jgi:hypothetical protein
VVALRRAGGPPRAGPGRAARALAPGSAAQCAADSFSAARRARLRATPQR